MSHLIPYPYAQKPQNMKNLVFTIIPKSPNIRNKYGVQPL